MSPEVAGTDGCETGKSGMESKYGRAMQALCRYADGTNSVTGVDTRKSLGELLQSHSFTSFKQKVFKIQTPLRRVTSWQPGTQLLFVLIYTYAQASRS